MPVISVHPSFASFMFRARLSQRPRLAQPATLPSSWRHLAHDRRIEDRSEPSIGRSTTHDEPLSRTVTNDKPRLSIYDLNMKARIWEWSKHASINLRHCADDFTAKSKSTFSQLGSWLNQITGYEEIEALKKGVVRHEERINSCRLAARMAKQTYNEALIKRANSQREVSDLLQRKTTWTAVDVARFTELVPQDHHLQQEEERTKAAVDEAEDIVEREFSELMRLILARYHEEQVWSDKIRSASTYGSLVALGLNMLVFISAILVVEPWKRRRLVQTFEDKISELGAANATMFRESMDILSDQIEQQRWLLRESEGNARNDGVPFPEAVALDAGRKGKEIEQIISIRGLHLSKRHLEIAAVTTGAFVAGVVTSTLMNK